MTNLERKAAMEAVYALLKRLDPETDYDAMLQSGGAGGNKPAHDKDYIKAWNKIMKTYDKDEISDETLEKLLQDILSGRIKELDL